MSAPRMHPDDFESLKQVIEDIGQQVHDYAQEQAAKTRQQHAEEIRALTKRMDQLEDWIFQEDDEKTIAAEDAVRERQKADG